ncbi:MAG: hypothetical protein H7Z13_12570 [Ferruginibacter sp.]|nr:hypothetical protein [Ferruginibacter sp.]
MKKTVLLLLFLSAIYHSIAQSAMPDTTQPALTKEDYLEKSKNNRTGALVSLIGGGTLFMIGGIVMINDLNNSLENLFTTNETNTNDALSGALVITGSLAMLGSIPLFKAASKNKHKAYSVSFKNEPALQFQGNTVFYKPVPSLSMKIRL